MTKQIVIVGRSPIASPDLKKVAYTSDSSILDGDIILVSIDVSSYSSYDTFQGKPCLSDDTSFRLVGKTEHWRSEIRAALADGKTVIVILNSAPMLSVATGQKEYSGTGRNARTTRIVQDFDPYSVIPSNFGKVIRHSGERIKPSSDMGMLATYWSEFGPFSKYEVYIDGFKGSSLLETATGRKTVAGIVRQAESKGTLLFIPPPDFAAACEARLSQIRDSPRRKKISDPAAQSRRAERERKQAEASVVNQFIAAIVGIDKSARSNSERTPPPEWSSDPKFVLREETVLIGQIKDLGDNIARLKGEKSELGDRLLQSQELRGLLFEKGKPLERSVLIAMRLLGFCGEGSQEEDSEFDAVLIDPEGRRFIGEAEGKDDKAVNIDKLDQLDRNLREDFSRQQEGTAKFATGILFANAYRFTAPQERNEFFTQKCLIGADRSRVSLVRSTDLFRVAKRLADEPDEQFASACRQAIVDAFGAIVQFPD